MLHASPANITANAMNAHRNAKSKANCAPSSFLRTRMAMARVTGRSVPSSTEWRQSWGWSSS
jgi:hypothetical protein